MFGVTRYEEVDTYLVVKYVSLADKKRDKAPSDLSQRICEIIVHEIRQ